jgi:hypothetical protein
MYEKNIPKLFKYIFTLIHHSYFTNYIHFGKKIKKGQIDSGDIIENK